MDTAWGQKDSSRSRIRTPLIPEILKSSMSWTMVSLYESEGSLSLTWRETGYLSTPVTAGGRDQDIRYSHIAAV